MSFILDALKKSENERQRRVGPSLADVQVRPRTHNRPWWAAGVAALLVINLGVLIAVLTRGGTSATQAGRSAPAPVTTPGDAAPAPAANTISPAPASQPAAGLARSTTGATVSSSPAVRSLAEEAARLEEPDTAAPYAPGPLAAAAVPEGPPIVRSVGEPTTVSPMPASSAPPVRGSTDSEVLPTHHDLTASGTQLPDLHLDIHVHSTNPAERFVFINMRKYVEGQSLNEGPTLERITPDGAVLNQRGLRFLLARQ